MAAFRVVLTIIFILVCIAVTVLILMQHSDDEGLGSLGGMSNSYWNQNKSRSAEGTVVKITRWLVAGVIVFAVVLNLGF